MVIITNIYFPPQKAAEMREILITLHPIPEYLAIKGQYFHGEGEKGIHSITIYEFENDKESDSYRFIMTNRIKPFFNVSGFSFSCDVWLETLEGFQMMDVE